jgi:hypothetical protein
MPTKGEHLAELRAAGKALVRAAGEPDQAVRGRDQQAEPLTAFGPLVDGPCASALEECP